MVNRVFEQVLDAWLELVLAAMGQKTRRTLTPLYLLGRGRPNAFFTPVRPVGLSQTQMLQVGTGNARHQRAPVQAGPGATFESVEPEFLL